MHDLLARSSPKGFFVLRLSRYRSSSSPGKKGALLCLICTYGFQRAEKSALFRPRQIFSSHFAPSPQRYHVPAKTRRNPIIVEADSYTQISKKNFSKTHKPRKGKQKYIKRLKLHCNQKTPFPQHKSKNLFDSKTSKMQLFR